MISIVSIMSFIIAEELISQARPRTFHITNSTSDPEGEMACYIIREFPNHIPCFNATLMSSLSDNEKYRIIGLKLDEIEDIINTPTITLESPEEKAERNIDRSLDNREVVIR